MHSRHHGASTENSYDFNLGPDTIMFWVLAPLRSVGIYGVDQMSAIWALRSLKGPRSVMNYGQNSGNKGTT